jgi:cytochrome c556
VIPVAKKVLGTYSIVMRRRPRDRDDEPTAVTRMYDKVREEQERLKAKTDKLVSQADELVDELEDAEGDGDEDEDESTTATEGE